MTTVPFTDARNRFSDLVDSVDRTHDRVVITRHGKAAAVLVAPDDLEALEETIDVLASPEAMRQLAESRQDRKRGDVLDQAELAELMRKRKGT